MQWIAPGTFIMGDMSNGPAHLVHLTRGYWLGRTEVTQAQWQAVMGGNPAKFPGATRPVEQVSWNEATEFCRRLTASEKNAGRVPPGYEYRLPTDAEWERACQAGTTDEYDSHGALDTLGWYKENAQEKTHEVATKAPNAWGLFDLHGNVWEWCYDFYRPYTGEEATDPVALDPDPAVPRGAQRVNRGGGFLTGPVRFRFASRDKDGADSRNHDMGFRPALAPQIKP
jgi:formylglycine-generating enzyme required for sulfatase activity